MLQALARAVGQGVRGHDVVARYGGEEFLILLPGHLHPAGHGTGRTPAPGPARHLNVAEDGRAIPVTASFGAASLDATTRNWDSLVVNADRACTRHKQAGKDRVARAGQPA